MEHSQVKWGRPRDDIYGSYDYNIHNAGNKSASLDTPRVNTQAPIVTGTSVIGIKFDKGVILAADNLASYGSLARFTDQERLFQVSKNTVIGLGGDISDLQYIERMIQQLEIDENYEYDGHDLRAPHVHEYLSNVFYNRRSKMDPLWNSCLVAGFDDQKKPYLSYVDLLGVTYSSPVLGTGYGAYLAVPLLRKLVDKDGDEEHVTEQQARQVIDECMKVLFYRDARSLDKYTVATISDEGIKFDKDVRCQNMSWKFADSIRGYGTQRE